MKRVDREHDRALLFTIGLLLLFGIVMIYDATVIFAQETFGGAYRFVFQQIAWVTVGLIGFSVFYKINYEKIRKIAFPVFVLAVFVLFILALISVVIPCSSDFDVVFTPCINGARRWVYLNPPPFPPFPIVGILGLQPSEFAKLALVIYLSVILEKNIKSPRSETPVFWVYFIITGLIAFLILLQPNMSTAVLLFVIGSVIYFASGATIAPFFVVGPAMALLGSLFILSSSYRRARLLTFLKPGGDVGELNAGYHIRQIMIALGSGGLFGVGLGQSRQKFQYLPEVSSDSIFAVIGEELGFIGTTGLIIVFAFLIYKGYTIAKNSPDLLGRLLASGITTWIAVQFFVNVAAMTKIIPLTGVPIPLISYGGSSTVFSLMGLGILANISRNS